MTGQIKAALAAIIAALAFSAGWVVKGWQAGKTVVDLKAEQDRGDASRAEAARTEETQTAIKEASMPKTRSTTPTAWRTLRPALRFIGALS